MEEEEAIIEHLQSMAEGAKLEIVSAEEMDGGAVFAIFNFEGEVRGTNAAVYYPDTDLLFTPDDWQGDYPETPEEIDRFRWIDSASDEALVVGGLPVVFTSLRDDARKRFGETVRERREELGLTGEELAKRSGLQASHISRIEAGRYGVTLDTITRLQAVLGQLV